MVNNPQAPQPEPRLLSLGSLEPYVRFIERMGAFAVLIYMVLVWMPEVNNQMRDIALKQAQQTAALERLVDSVDRLERRIGPGR